MAHSRSMDLALQQVGNGSVALNGRLEFDTAVRALELISAQIDEHNQLSIDLAGVTSANSVGLALMAEWKSLAAAGGKSVSFVNVPSSLLKIADICQVEHLLVN